MSDDDERVVKAFYPGECLECYGSIVPGQNIVKVNGSWWRHVKCPVKRHDKDPLRKASE